MGPCHPSAIAQNHGYKIVEQTAIGYQKVYSEALILDPNFSSKLNARTLHLMKSSSEYDFVSDIDIYVGQHIRWVHKTAYEAIAKSEAKQIIMTKREPGMSYIDGASCSKCGTFTVYAEAPFQCFSCRQDPFRSVYRSISDE